MTLPSAMKIWERWGCGLEPNSAGRCCRESALTRAVVLARAANGTTNPAVNRPARMLARQNLRNAENRLELWG